MPRPKVSRPTTPLPELLRVAAEIGLSVEIVQDVSQWPLWPADHPYRYDACYSKAAYLHAETAIAEAIRAYRMRGVKVRVYPCPVGLHYHLSKLKDWQATQDPGPERNPERNSGLRPHSRNKRRTK